ncbi:DUF1810 domain-containing protein [Rhizobium daejeonense]|uniref:DUF1810 domain-containing protein n=1 Tax=Rhizobium daejeonense TaxID=240521 RepID=A0A6M1S3M0_9HYPH|nr:DUF1810 domain-containing protein [Rhizobium daejeonense]NGO62988.1 DUF1810 domain-containing protein [Rhizobium daejeonense]
MNDPFALERFVLAQGPVYDHVLAELRNGRKTSHWMWFVFPQVNGLGTSPMAQKYAISSLEEATAYLDHPVLGPRLWECCNILMTTEGLSAEDIFGYPDVLKLRSSMTLFSKAAPAPNIFGGILEKYYGGEPDPGTLPLIR